jgi:hypothetical protein
MFYYYNVCKKCFFDDTDLGLHLGPGIDVDR